MALVQLGELFDKVKPTLFAFDGMLSLYALAPLPSINDLKPPQAFYSAKPQDETPLSMTVTLQPKKPSSGKLEEDEEEFEEEPKATVESQILSHKLASVSISSNNNSVDNTPPPKLDSSALHYVIQLADEVRYVSYWATLICCKTKSKA
jgi:hypothetical protein